MQSRWIGPALLIALAGVGDASAAGSPAFCRTWLKVCNQTCPMDREPVPACAMGVIRPASRPDAFRSTFPVHAARTAPRTRPQPRRPGRRSMRAAPSVAARDSEGLATSADPESAFWVLAPFRVTCLICGELRRQVPFHVDQWRARWAKVPEMQDVGRGGLGPRRARGTSPPCPCPVPCFPAWWWVDCAPQGSIWNSILRQAGITETSDRRPGRAPSGELPHCPAQGGGRRAQ